VGEGRAARGWRGRLENEPLSQDFLLSTEKRRKEARRFGIALAVERVTTDGAGSVPVPVAVVAVVAGMGGDTGAHRGGAGRINACNARACKTEAAIVPRLRTVKNH
jgi:hypothetical protein